MICCVIFLQGCSQEQEVKKEMINMETALLAATEKNETNTVISLLKQGANVNIPDNDGVTPLEHARAHHFEEIEKILLEGRK
ncbi:ankyrin repeat domain-containing protein [Bacillus cereus]